jgi:hypothetical protein
MTFLSIIFARCALLSSCPPPPPPPCVVLSSLVLSCLVLSCRPLATEFISVALPIPPPRQSRRPAHPATEGRAARSHIMSCFWYMIGSMHDGSYEIEVEHYDRHGALHYNNESVPITGWVERDELWCGPAGMARPTRRSRNVVCGVRCQEAILRAAGATRRGRSRCRGTSSASSSSTRSRRCATVED